MTSASLNVIVAVVVFGLFIAAWLASATEDDGELSGCARAAIFIVIGLALSVVFFVLVRALVIVIHDAWLHGFPA